MSDVEKSAFEAGVMSALAAIAAALKSSLEFNNEALVNIAQHILDAGTPHSFDGLEAKQAFARPLRVLVSDQAALTQWLETGSSKH
ncbi:hypothetical protein [Pseudomonas savastanoi]|uniref:hypothetical protein n=1 Tax=Pseudomonas savastanoi TaxID=29438 RepID=UPI000F006AB6|nr:hypothetical protein [Pseudomonas savastanoi]RMU50477.1 hypothetical protein ALP28_01677 [Pseudomonas savastanoi pv. nerii]